MVKRLTSTVVVGIEQGKEGADGKDIVVLGKARHCDSNVCRHAGVLCSPELEWELLAEKENKGNL